MSKAMVVKMMVAVAAVALVCGCAGAPKGPSDEDLIKTRVGQFCEGLLAHDLDKTGAAMSDEFYHPEAGDKEAALARRVAMYLLRQETGFSLAQIGEEFGARDASAVTIACKKIATDMDTSLFLKRKIPAIQEKIQSLLVTDN